MSKSKYSILIICEGSNTEPNFFSSLRDEIINGTYKLDNDPVINILPEPKVSEEPSEQQPSPHKYPRRSRTVKPASVGEEPQEIPGLPPLKWVLHGQEELKNGTYNEVWTVFDHYNHPTRKEAFEAAKNEINGGKVNIAFSSISFEYYLLLHFERIFYPFKKSECRIKKEQLKCSTDKNHPEDCQGAKCIGGYARRHGYWDDTKSEDVSSFDLVRHKLEIGFWNAEWLRFQSDKLEPGIPEYERNPYITTDSVVKRLTGDGYYLRKIIDIDQYYTLAGIQIVFNKNRELQITNTGTVTMIIPPDSISNILPDYQRSFSGERALINPNESVVITLSDTSSAYVFKYGKYQIMVVYPEKEMFI
jgi:hypothetical protein